METRILVIMIAVAVGALLVGALLAFLVLRTRSAPRVDAPPPPPPPPKPTAEPLRLLALLQREGRLVDFLLEDIQGFTDPQVGAAVREIHRKCAKVLQEHVELEPVRHEGEGEQVTVPTKFDPSAIRVTGTSPASRLHRHVGPSRLAGEVAEAVAPAAGAG